MTVSYNCEGNGEIHLDVLKAICGDRTSGKDMIDLCCGFAPQTRNLGYTDKIFVDSVSRDLGNENDNFIVIDIFKFLGCQFPVPVHSCFLLDAVEHFKKEDGKKIIEWMIENAERSIIFTPLGDYIIETTETDNPDSHKSGWLPEDFDGWGSIIFPNFHPLLNMGAFFAFKCKNIAQEFDRIINELNQKEWAK